MKLLFTLYYLQKSGREDHRKIMVVCFSRHHQETLSTYKSITLLVLFTIELPGIITCFWPLFWGGGVPSNHLPGHGSEKGYKPKQKMQVERFSIVMATFLLYIQFFLLGSMPNFDFFSVKREAEAVFRPAFHYFDLFMFFPAYIPRRRTALGWEIAQNCSAM
jgi:hypothetical protein